MSEPTHSVKLVRYLLFEGCITNPIAEQVADVGGRSTVPGAAHGGLGQTARVRDSVVLYTFANEMERQKQLLLGRQSLAAVGRVSYVTGYTRQYWLKRFPQDAELFSQALRRH